MKRRDIEFNKVFLEGLAAGDESFNPPRATPLRLWGRRLALLTLVTAFVLPPSFRVALTEPTPIQIETPKSVIAGGLLLLPYDTRIEMLSAMGRPLISIPRLKALVAPVGLEESEPVLIRVLGKVTKPKEILGRLGLLPRVINFYDLAIPIQPDEKPSDRALLSFYSKPKSLQNFHKFEENLNSSLETWPELKEKIDKAILADSKPQLSCWQMPVKVGVLSEFAESRTVNKTDHYSHRGIDFKTPSQTQVRSVGPGTVLTIESYPERARTLVVHHGGGLVSKYSSLRDTIVSSGDKVKAGSVLGMAGGDENLNTAHLHFEIEWAGHALNPREFVEFSQKICK